jgi:hypothetical protein
MQNSIIKITQKNFSFIKRTEIGCFILPDTADTAFADEFIKQAHAENKLVLTEGNNALDFYLTHHTDGLIIDTSKDDKPQKSVKEIQKKAPKAILGVICRNRRHEAMLVSECEPNFVIFKVWAEGFDANKELLAWYNELFLIQNAAQIEEPCDYASLPTDFVILDDIILQK